MKRLIQKILNIFKKIPEKKITVVVPSYNNALWYKKNLDSIFKQKYKNFKVIYLDDCSNDKTFELVTKYIKEKSLENKITIIKNEKREGATANRYKGSTLTDPNSIVILMDGDDWFAHNKVLKKINKIYSHENIWITYGQFRRWPSGEKGHCKKLSQDYDFRKMDQWYTSALRTYYGWLFRKIKKEDLFYKNDFFKVAGDVAEMLPMLEMARGHIKFIKEVTYVYNQQTPFNDCKIKKNEQKLMFEYIKNKNSYKKLSNEEAFNINNY